MMVVTLGGLVTGREHKKNVFDAVNLVLTLAAGSTDLFSL